MLRRTLRSGVRLGLFAGIALAIYRVLQARQAQPEIPVRDPWPPVAPPEPVNVGLAEAPAPPQEWVAPIDGGACPVSHPIKGKLSSKIFHLPGMFAYDRTNADRCYATEAAAEADGLHRAKR
ncbi:MAG: hypothetical protein JO367_04045 [Actinobacteria bacterium]|nr:hypothetical protein [Actinomycetota bacterium]MBV9252704.1 hypothetical protein [Actinomycetota bacterium]MBV9933450.1 hypothetical protein [Actinomycetota bacterium]